MSAAVNKTVAGDKRHKDTFNIAARMAKVGAGLNLSNVEKAEFYITKNISGTFSAYSGVLSTKTPSQILDAVAKGFPELKGSLDIIKGDKELAQAFKDAIVKDPTMMEGLKKLAGTSDGMKAFGHLEDALKSPVARKALTLGLQNLANQDDVKFEHLKEFSDSIVGFKVSDIAGGKLRIKNALIGLGIEEKAANTLVQEAQAGFIKNKLAGLQTDPIGTIDRLIKLAGGTEKLGVVGSMWDSIKGFANDFFKMIGDFMNRIGLGGVMRSFGFNNSPAASTNNAPPAATTVISTPATP